MPAVLWWAEHSKVSLFPSYSQLHWNALLAEVCEDFSTLTAHHHQSQRWGRGSCLQRYPTHAFRDSAHLERSEKQQLLGVPYWASRKCRAGQAETEESSTEKQIWRKLLGRTRLHAYPKWFTSSSEKLSIQLPVSSHDHLPCLRNRKACLVSVAVSRETRADVKSFSFNLWLDRALTMAWCCPVAVRMLRDLSLAWFFWC